jgi:hypothetical protein
MKLTYEKLEELHERAHDAYLDPYGGWEAASAVYDGFLQELIESSPKKRVDWSSD